jgi:hypothetical protein
LFVPVVSLAGSLDHRLRLWQAFGLLGSRTSFAQVSFRITGSGSTRFQKLMGRDDATLTGLIECGEMIPG